MYYRRKNNFFFSLFMRFLYFRFELILFKTIPIVFFFYEFSTKKKILIFYLILIIVLLLLYI